MASKQYNIWKYLIFILFTILLCYIIYISISIRSRNIPVEGFEKNKKIAFCFLIYNEINHEELWNTFFKDVDQQKYNIYIHYKENRKLQYFDKYKIKDCVETKWADKSLVKASNKLFKTAYESDTANYKFILLSNSCVPFKSFEYIYSQLTENDKGYINSFNLKDCTYNCATKLNKAYPHFFSKCSQWVIFNRLLIEKLALVDDSFIDEWCSDVWAPDEIYYFTFLKVKGLENEVYITNFVSAGASTFIYWNGMDYLFKDDELEKKEVANSALKNYSFVRKDELDYLLNSGSLFGRKFVKNCNVVVDVGKNTDMNSYISKIFTK